MDIPKEEVERYHFVLSCFGEKNSEVLKLYPSLSWLSRIFVVTVLKCFLWLSLQDLTKDYGDSDFSRTGSTTVETVCD